MFQLYKNNITQESITNNLYEQKIMIRENAHHAYSASNIKKELNIFKKKWQ